MSQIAARPSFFTGRINCYCPNAKYAADHVIDGATRISFGAPAVASTTALLATVDITAGKTKAAFTAGIWTSDANYGRCLQVVLSGAGTPAITIYGRDFWGQPMLETFTGNGATPVIGLKAFMYADSYSADATAVTLSIGTTDKLGLPYKTVKVLSEESDGAVATLGTLVTPVVTDPATAITGDPRGTYDPNTTLNAVRVITAYILCDSTANSSSNGGLHGIRHYYA